MLTLFIDTHYKDVLLCLFKDDELIDRIIINDVKNTSVVVMPNIVKLLENNNLKINDINKIAVIKGPGSFTSIRIGITIAKVLAYSLSIPIVSLTSIDLIGLHLDKPSYVAVKENNGAFISFYESNESEIKYLKNNDYNNFINNNKVIDDIKLDYNKIIKYINKLKEESSFNINPLYIKDIGF